MFLWEHGVQDAFELSCVEYEGNGIRRTVGFPEGIGGDAGDIFHFEEDGFFRDPDFGVQCSNAIDEGLRACGGVFASIAIAESCGGGQVGEAFRADVFIEVKKVWQGDGIGEAMGYVIALAKAMRDGMDVTDESACEGSAGEVGGAKHGFAGFDFPSFGAGGAEV